MIKQDRDINGRVFPGRLFIDITREGCSCGCKYCYVRYIQEEELVDITDVMNLKKELTKREDFVAGKQGTLLTFGSHSDLFKSTRLWEYFLEALRIVADLGNPIQISTKFSIKEDLAFQIACEQAYESQVVVFVSCPLLTLKRDILEPDMPLPEERFEGIKILRRYGIKNCLLIKPFIHDCTSQDLEAYVNKIKECRPDGVCIGNFYLDTSILDRMRNADINLRQYIEPRPLNNATRMHHPLEPELENVLMPAPDAIDYFESQLKKQTPPIPVVESSPCIVAWVQGQYCPTKVWKLYQKLCRGKNSRRKYRCNDCELLYMRHSDPPVSKQHP